MMNDKVIVTSMVNGLVSINMPQHHLVRAWPQKGAKLPVDKDALREAIYEPGVEYMFKNGMLYIDDMDFKIELGLEEEGTKIPTAIVPVDEKYLERLLKRVPVFELKNAIKAMNGEQRHELIDYAAKQNDLQMDRISAIKELTGTDLFKVIELKKQREE
jgi:hypothetical protein